MGPTGGSRAMAQIQSRFRPVLITCTIKPAWMAMDRIGIRYNGESPHTRSQGPRVGYCSENGTVLGDSVPEPAGPMDVGAQGITQHAPGARIGIAVSPATQSLARLRSQNRNLTGTRAGYVNASRASCRAADLRRDARRRSASGASSGVPAIVS